MIRKIIIQLLGIYGILMVVASYFYFAYLISLPFIDWVLAETTALKFSIFIVLLLTLSVIYYYVIEEVSPIIEDWLNELETKRKTKQRNKQYNKHNNKHNNYDNHK